jgi:hypothetical protein
MSDAAAMLITSANAIRGAINPENERTYRDFAATLSAIADSFEAEAAALIYAANEAGGPEGWQKEAWEMMSPLEGVREDDFVDSSLNAHPFSIPVGLYPMNWGENLMQQVDSFLGGNYAGSLEKSVMRRMFVEAMDAYRDGVATFTKGRAMMAAANISFDVQTTTDPTASALAAREQITARIRDLAV